MARQIEITIQGTVGTEPRLRETSASRRMFCHFRVASTPSYVRNGQWCEGETLWFTAKAWGEAAQNLCSSLHKGDPVILSGRLSQESWTKPGESRPVYTQVLTVTAGGLDATRTVCFRKQVARSPRGADISQTVNHEDKTNDEALLAGTGEPHSLDAAEDAQAPQAACSHCATGQCSGDCESTDVLAADHWETAEPVIVDALAEEEDLGEYVDVATGEISGDQPDDVSPVYVLEEAS